MNETGRFFEQRDACPLCRSDMPLRGERFRIQQLDQLVRVIQCPVCGLVYKELRLTDAGLDLVYGGNYAHHQVRRTKHDQGAAEYVRRMRLAQGSRHLDYGCGNGSVVFAARDAGIESYGADPFLPDFIMKEEGRDWFLKRAVECDDFKDIGEFDAVSLWAVIEHLESPLETFRGLSGVLKQGGQLVFNAPNADSLAARKDGAQWAMALLLEHSTFWTRSALDYLASSTGFTVQTVRRCGIPYPLSCRKDVGASFGIPDLNAEKETGRLPVAVSGKEQNTGVDVFSRRVVKVARQLVKNRNVGIMLRAILHATGLGDHYFVVMRKRGSVGAGGIR